MIVPEPAGPAVGPEAADVISMTMRRDDRSQALPPQTSVECLRDLACADGLPLARQRRRAEVDQDVPPVVFAVLNESRKQSPNPTW